MVDVALFCEDRGHELFSRALVARIARELAIDVDLRVMSSSGGQGNAVKQLRAWQRSIERGLVVGRPDLLVVVIDANCTGSVAKRQEIRANILPNVIPRWVVGCPDPHVERWCIADAAAFQSTIGAAPFQDPGKCERGLYKKLLRDSLARAKVPVITDVMEIAPDVVDKADLHRAGQAQPSLRAFVDSLKDELKKTVT